MTDEAPAVDKQELSGRFGACFESFRPGNTVAPKQASNIDIVVPVYGGLEFLPAFFDSLLNDFPAQSRLVIIDDANRDQTLLAYLDAIKTRVASARILRNDRNLGFTGSVNRGLRASLSHTVILNTDIELPQGWADRLLAPIFARPREIASVTPFTNAGTICSFPYPNNDGRLPYDLPTSVIDSIFKNFEFQEPAVEIPTGVGFCMALSRHALDTIGVFDEEAFPRGYGEENDWCMRARAAGLTNVHVLNLFVSHRDGGSFPSTEKRALTESHTKVLRAMHPTYREDVHGYVKRDVLGPLRSTVAATICLAAKSRRTRLLVTFARGGGSHYYARRLVEESVGMGDSVIQASILSGSNDIRLDIFTPQETFTFGTGPLEDLTIFFERFDVAEVTINQLYVSEDPNRILDFFRTLKERNRSI